MMSPTKAKEISGVTGIESVVFAAGAAAELCDSLHWARLMSMRLRAIRRIWLGAGILGFIFFALVVLRAKVVEKLR